MSHRQRGVVLTDRGKQRLEAAIASAQDQEKYGARFTQPELESRAGLSIKTIKKILDQRVPIDEASVRTLFEAFETFGLELEPADYGQPEPATLPISPESTARRQPSNARIDWGEKPDTALFFGRTAELATLNQWVQGDQCRLITLLGMGGIGKTSLAAKLANQVYDRFDYVIWRSLREAPPLDEILVRLIQFLSDQQETEINLPTRLGERIIRLLHYLREHRCLVVLDNLESILQAETAGHYRDGYEGYGELIQRIGSTEHQSCLLLTSRECPRELAPLAGDLTPVRLWSVGSIDTEAGREILKTKGLALDEADDQGLELIRRCSGNPQALHLVATAIQREFLGDVDDFLQEQVTAVEDVRSLLDQHLSRLAPLERSVLFWLAINREPVGLDELMEDLLPPVTKQEVRGALRGLSDRYLIETVGKQFTLQNVIMEFTTDRFVERVCIELRNQQFHLFHNHALIKATAKDYVRESQIRLILGPISNQIGKVEQQVRESLHTVRNHPLWISGYTPGNLLNLLCQNQATSQSIDFSNLTLRQAHLKGMKLHDFNLSNALFSHPSLTQTFSSIHTAIFSHNSQLLATGDGNGYIQLWRVTDQKLLANFEGHTSAVRSLAFSPDDKILASGGEELKIRLWSIQDFQCLQVFQGHTNWVRSLSFSPNGQFLASSSDDSTIRIWNMQEKKCLNILRGHTNFVGAVAFHHDGRLLASGSDDLTIRLWDFQENECIHIFRGHKKFVSSLAFSLDGKLLVSGSGDCTIRLWDIKKRRYLNEFTGHTGWINSVAFSPDGNSFASGSEDSTIRVWNINQKQCLHEFVGHSQYVWVVAFNPDGSFLASGSEDSTIRLWDTQQYKCLNVLSGHTNGIRSIIISPDGKSLASGSEDSMVRLWDVQTGKCLHVFSGHINWVRSIVFSPNGEMLASSSEDSKIRLWNVHARECIHVFEECEHRVRVVSFSPDKKLFASSGKDFSVWIWDLQNYKYLFALKGHTSNIRSISFSPDGRFLISGSEDSTLFLWDVQKRKCLHIFEGHTDWVRSVSFSPDGRFIVSGSSDLTVRLWHVQKQKCLHVFTGHTNRVWSVAFSPNNDFIASGCGDGIIRLWDVRTKQCTYILLGHANRVESVCFSPHDNILVSGSRDGTIRIWDVQTGSCLSVLQAPRPYEGTNINGAKGLSEAQFASLLNLGAIDSSLSQTP
jgi:WD40 repeat protein